MPDAYGEVVWFGRRGAGATLAVAHRSNRIERGPADNGGKRAVLREEHEVSRKAIAQGRPECSRCPVCSCAVLFAQIARETAGAASTRSSLCPLFSRRANEDAKLGRITSREGASSFSCHCERSEAIHLSTCGAMDCFAALAMTGRDLLRSVPPPGDAAVFVGWVERSETHHLLRRR